MHLPDLVDFSESEIEMIRMALGELNVAGYDITPIRELIRADFPVGYRGMSLDNGAALGKEAFLSQAWLNHVLEEELLHLIQKAQGLTATFGPNTALELEQDVNDKRKFPAPDS